MLGAFYGIGAAVIGIVARGTEQVAALQRRAGPDALAAWSE